MNYGNDGTRSGLNPANEAAVVDTTQPVNCVPFDEERGLVELTPLVNPDEGAKKLAAVQKRPMRFPEPLDVMGPLVIAYAIYRYVINCEPWLMPLSMPSNEALKAVRFAASPKTARERKMCRDWSAVLDEARLKDISISAFPAWADTSAKIQITIEGRPAAEYEVPRFVAEAVFRECRSGDDIYRTFKRVAQVLCRQDAHYDLLSRSGS